MTTPADTPHTESAIDEAAPATSLVGTVISGRYRVESSLGEGGMGAVYLAEHMLMHKRLAIKVLHPEMMRMPEVVARFEREAMAAAHIEHPNVAAATDFGKLDDGSFFLVLEYVQGKSLRELLSEGPVPVDRAVHIALQIAGALNRAHGLGIVHRDMKPENVMLVERDGDPDFVKVLDFGIAKVPVGELFKDSAPKSRQQLTQLGIVYGTPEYMAPEQALGQDVDARADLYALGIILYEMLTGSRPFEADSPVKLLGMQVTQAPPLLRERAPDLVVPPSLEVLLFKLLEKEAPSRPQSSREVFEILEGIRAILRPGGGIGSQPSYPNLAFISSPQLEIVSANTAIDLLAAPRPAPGPTRAWQKLKPLKERAATSLRTQWTRLEPVVEGAMAKAGHRWPAVEQRAIALRSRLPSGLRTLSPAALTTGVASALLVALVGMVMLTGWLVCAPSSSLRAISYRSSSSGVTAESSAPAPLPPPNASAEQVKEALAKGPEAVEKLIVQFPRDASLQTVLARAYMAANQPDKALAVYKKVIAEDPKAAEELEVGQNVVVACQNDATSDTAYAMLESEMGSRGVDLLYWLAYESKAAGKYQLRAAKSLQKKDVRERGTPAAQIAYDFRSAGGCEGKYKLLSRAKTDGDKRMLPLLRPLFATGGCGFMSWGDCWKCMRRDSLLATTVKEIEGRAAGGGEGDDKPKDEKPKDDKQK